MPGRTRRAEARQRASVRGRPRHAGRGLRAQRGSERGLRSRRRRAGRNARVRAAVEATLEAVGQNTNLGIVLLCAPLAAAAEAEDAALRPALARTLDRLDLTDAGSRFRRHRRRQSRRPRPRRPARRARARRDDARASDGGGGGAGSDRTAICHRVRGHFRPRPAGAGERPRTARRRALARRSPSISCFSPRSPTRTSRGNLARAPPRRSAARRRRWGRAFAAARHPDEIEGRLMSWDAALKSRGINPGTSADLTVATLFARLSSSLSAARKAEPPSCPQRQRCLSCADYPANRSCLQAGC